MFVQTEITPNPNSLKFLPGKAVSPNESFEVTKKDQTKNELVRNLFSINGVEGIFLGGDFITVNKYDDVEWEEIKHIIISLINSILGPDELSASVHLTINCASLSAVDIVVASFMVAPAPISLAKSLALVIYSPFNAFTSASSVSILVSASCNVFVRRGTSLLWSMD